MDWTATPHLWVEHLRAHDWRLGVGDELHLHTLAARLRERNTPVNTPQDAARWFGPLLCGSADDQRRLLPLLQSWNSSDAPAPEPLAPALGRVARAVVPPAGPASWSRRLGVNAGVALAVAVAVAMAVILLIFLGADLLERPAPAPGVSAPAAQPAPPSTPGSLGSALEIGFGALLWALPLLTALLVRRLRSSRDTALLRGLAPRDALRETLAIALPRFELFTIEALRAAVADLRRHRVVPTDWIDGQRSVRATVREGGRVTLLAGQRRAEPEYLLLVDLKRSDDILAALADLLVGLLEQGDVRVERLDFHGDPTHLRRVVSASQHAVQVEQTDLATLHAACPHHRVIVLSDAMSFCDAQGRHLRPWVDQLRQWSELALLTPVPAAQWGPRERSIIRIGLFVTEANAAGLKELASVMRINRGNGGALADAAKAHAAGARPHPLDRRMAVDPFRWLGDTPPAADEISDLLAELRGALGERAMLYLQALAVFPVLKPRLTLALGRLLADRDGLPLLDESTLALLCRVPWLRQARLPDWLRRALLAELTRAPGNNDAGRVRAAWATVLAPRTDADGASARPDLLSLGVVRAVDSRLPALVSRLLARSAAPQQREALLLAFMSSEHIPDLAVALPGSAGASWLGVGDQRRARRRLLELSLIAGAVLLAMLGAFLSPLAWSQLREQPGVAVAWGPACWTAYGMAGLVCLISTYRHELAPQWAGRWQWLARPGDVAQIWRLLPKASAVATLTLALAAVQFEGIEAHSLGRIALAVWLTVWCFLVSGRAPLVWAPLLVALQGSVGLPTPWGEKNESVSLQGLAPVLLIWLVGRGKPQPWEDWRALLSLCMPLWVVRWTIGPITSVGGWAGGLLMTWIFARMVCDADFRRRWLGPQGLDGRAVVLLLALSTLAPGMVSMSSVGLALQSVTELIVLSAVLAGLCVHRSLRWLLLCVPVWVGLMLLQVNLKLPDNLLAMRSPGEVLTPIVAWILGSVLRGAIRSPDQPHQTGWLAFWLLTCVVLTDVNFKVSAWNGSRAVLGQLLWSNIYPLLVVVGAVALAPSWRKPVALLGVGLALLPLVMLEPRGTGPLATLEWSYPSYWRIVNVLSAYLLMVVLRTRLADFKATLGAVKQPPPAAGPPRLRLLDWPGWLVCLWLAAPLAVSAVAWTDYVKSDYYRILGRAVAEGNLPVQNAECPSGSHLSSDGDCLADTASASAAADEAKAPASAASR